MPDQEREVAMQTHIVKEKGWFNVYFGEDLFGSYGNLKDARRKADKLRSFYTNPKKNKGEDNA